MHQHFQDIISASIATKQQSATVLENDFCNAVAVLVAALQNDKKIMICGNGGSAADAQHFAAELVNRFEVERPPLAAIALTTDTSTLTSIANDYSYSEIYSKQIAAISSVGDGLIAISTSGNSENINMAIQVAQQKGVKVIALTGKDGGILRGFLQQGDVELCVPSNSTARIQEMHIVILHALCDAIDRALFPALFE